MKSTDGFTINEILITITILGILVTLALPNYITILEKTRANEAVRILSILHAAQKRYYAENGVYTNDSTRLDVTIPASSNFNAPVISDTGVKVAEIERNNNKYKFEIDEFATITCLNQDAVSNPNLCQKLGFQDP